MQKSEVPQDKSFTYEGQHKLLYATDETGTYSQVTSSGWEVEETANQAAVKECNRLAAEAWQLCKDGEQSPLAYHMCKNRMDIPLLKQVTGIFEWRIKRHFQPKNFKQLSPSMLARYTDALGMTSEQLQSLPEEP